MSARRIISTSSIMVTVVLALAVTTQAGWHEDLQTDPIRSYGHGLVTDLSGNVSELTEEKVEAFQQHYIDRAWLKIQSNPGSNFESVRVEIENRLTEDGVSASRLRFWLLSWMITVGYTDDPIAQSRLHLRNGILDRFAGSTAPNQSELSEDTLKILGDQGVETELGTNNGGAAYLTECGDAGVPIPPDWGTSGWTNEGPLSPNFLGGDATVYTYESTSPRGGCIALPRTYGDPNTIALLGIICLGQDTSKACFWDNEDIPVGVVVPISDFVGGADLNPPNWNGGICSDCHSGENPWVVHPGSSLAAWGHKMPLDWHEPLVHPSWPQNPGPTLLLESVSGDPDGQACLSCHSSGYAGRFPRVSTELPGYCNTVLRNASRSTMPNTTDPALDSPLPGAGASGYGYRSHAEALEAACNSAPADGVVVPGGMEDDSTVVSRPIILGPLYECARAVQVRGAIRNAEIRVYVDGVLEAAVTALDPDGDNISVSALVQGQVVEATQVVDGLESAPSEKAEVRDHTLDYPDGLPAPVIDPGLIYECGRTIAVRHVNGAQVTVLTNGGNPVSYYTGGDWTNLPPAIRPFGLGDEYTASQSLCAEVSPNSAAEKSVPPPSPMPTPEVSSPIYEGQELVDVSNLAHGGLTRVEVTGIGVVSSFSTAVSRRRNVDLATVLGRPLMAGDAVQAEQELCSKGPRSPVLDETQGCAQIPPPEIRNPFAGQVSIEVLAAVPGARISVYDEAGNEVADGSGALIGTTRPLVEGELLRAVQTVGQCTSVTAFQVEVFGSLAFFLPEPNGLIPLAIGWLSLLGWAGRRARARVPQLPETGPCGPPCQKV